MTNVPYCSPEHKSKVSWYTKYEHIKLALISTIIFLYINIFKEKGDVILILTTGILNINVISCKIKDKLIFLKILPQS